MRAIIFVTLVAAMTAATSEGGPAFAGAETPARDGEVSPTLSDASSGGGQAPAQPGPAAPPAQEAGPVPPPDYAYDTASRRDPFVSLVNRGSDTRQGPPKGARPEGIAGVMVDEVAVRGIVQSRGSWVAMIAAPNGRSYTIRPGDRLMDGAVRAINGESVVLMQEVHDPLSLEKQREVRKQLRGEVK